MSEDALKQLKKQREERKEAYAEFKGMMQGLRLTTLSQADKDFLRILEFVMQGFKNFGDGLDDLSERTIYLAQRVETLEKEVKQLRHSMDTLSENQ